LEKKYTSNDLTIIIPTKDRPEKIKDLLDSISIQNVQCHRIIIVDGGKSIETIVRSYKDLPIEYYLCYPSGQIIQRNLALSKLTDEDKLIAFFDDDLVLMPDSLKYMMNMWNDVESETAGISFNIINSPPVKHTWYKALVGMSSKKMGTILPSGYNVPLSPALENIKTQWLCGGATVWKKSILENNINKEVQSRWAICEDITFSYPIGKKYPMYVCSAAKVRHEHVYDHNKKIDHFYYGRAATLWRLYFVMSNTNLSKTLFFYMIFAQVIIRFFQGVIFFRKDPIVHAFGQIYGCFVGIKVLLRMQNIISVLSEKN
jgi:glycosyltransferase involved in cell wall biosynthesis